MSGRSGTEKQLDAVIDKITHFGYKASKTILDMSDFDSFDNVVNNIVNNLGGIDILVNISVDKGIFELSTSD